MSRKNRNPHPRKPSLTDRYDMDYVNLPEYPQYCSVVAVPLKTIFYNLDADPHADDFYVAKHYGDKVMKTLAKKINCEVVA
jgi:hypothetical protein